MLVALDGKVCDEIELGEELRSQLDSTSGRATCVHFHLAALLAGHGPYDELIEAVEVVACAKLNEQVLLSLVQNVPVIFLQRCPELTAPRCKPHLVLIVTHKVLHRLEQELIQSARHVRAA